MLIFEQFLYDGKQDIARSLNSVPDSLPVTVPDSQRVCFGVNTWVRFHKPFLTTFLVLFYKFIYIRNHLKMTQPLIGLTKRLSQQNSCYFKMYKLWEKKDKRLSWEWLVNMDRRWSKIAFRRFSPLVFDICKKSSPWLGEKVAYVLVCERQGTHTLLYKAPINWNKKLSEKAHVI